MTASKQGSSRRKNVTVHGVCTNSQQVKFSSSRREPSTDGSGSSVAIVEFERSRSIPRREQPVNGYNESSLVDLARQHRVRWLRRDRAKLLDTHPAVR